MVVVVDGLAASGAYIAALSSEHIVAQETSLVGSIGVLFQYPNFTDVLKTIGIKVEEIKSSPLKAAPNGFEPTSPEARAAIEAIVSNSYAWFKGLVKDRRKMDDAQLAAVSDGRVFTGRQAVGLKLIDGLGNEKTALAWLAKEKKVPANTPVRDYSLQPRFSELSFLHVAAWTFEAVGLDGRLRTASRNGVQCKRSSDSTLTVSWRFGTLRRPIDSRGRAASMIKSELVQRIASQNPHLYQRDVENIVNAILGEITSAMAQGRPRRTARLRRLFGQAPAGPHRPQSAHRRAVSVDQKSVPFFKTGKEMRERLNRPGAV